MDDIFAIQDEIALGIRHYRKTEGDITSKDRETIAKNYTQNAKAYL